MNEFILSPACLTINIAKVNVLFYFIRIVVVVVVVVVIIIIVVVVVAAVVVVSLNREHLSRQCNELELAVVYTELWLTNFKQPTVCRS